MLSRYFCYLFKCSKVHSSLSNTQKPLSPNFCTYFELNHVEQKLWDICECGYKKLSKITVSSNGVMFVLITWYFHSNFVSIHKIFFEIKIFHRKIFRLKVSVLVMTSSLKYYFWHSFQKVINHCDINFWFIPNLIVFAKYAETIDKFGQICFGFF